MLLCELTPGRAAHVKKVTGPSPLQRRLTALGLAPGTLVRAEKPAPGGDPQIFSLRGYTLAMRRADAARVETEAL